MRLNIPEPRTHHKRNASRRSARLLYLGNSRKYYVYCEIKPSNKTWAKRPQPMHTATQAQRNSAFGKITIPTKKQEIPRSIQ